MLKNGFIKLPFLLLIVVGVLVVGYFILIQRSDTAMAPTETPDSTSSPQATPTGSKDGQVFCTQDAKLCPDGSYVGRTGPKCEFAPCPTIKWNNYSGTTHNFTVQYPVGWQVNAQNDSSIVFYKTVGEHKNEIYLVLENNPNRLSTQDWLKAVGVNTSGATTFQVNRLSAVRVSDSGALPTTHVFLSFQDKVAHFFVESETDFLSVFDSMAKSFKTN